jgi:hypothetical protein
MARIAHFLLPGFPLLSGWLTRMGLQHSPQAAMSEGNLFSPSSDQRRVEGGWRSARPKAPLMALAGAALLVGGVLLTLNRRNRVAAPTRRH